MSKTGEHRAPFLPALSTQLAVISAIVTLYLSVPVLRRMADTSELGQCALDLIGAFGVLWLLLLAAAAPGRLGRRQKLVRLAAGTGVFLLVLYLLADNAYYLFISRHLFLDDIQLMSIAVASGQFTVPAWVSELLIAAYAGWLLLFPLLLRFGEFLDQRLRRSVRLAVIPCAVYGSGMLGYRALAGVPFVLPPRHHELIFLFPWQVALLPRHPFGEAFDTRDLRVDSEMLQRAFKQMQDATDRIIQNPVAAQHRPDILFLVVEGLRSDMFTEQYMPLLWAEREEWLQLEHHFTAGANSGTGDFGLMSGLPAPFYPLQRRAGVTPAPLQILKQLGYSRSLYVTKSMQYDRVQELVFRDGLDRLVQPPEEEPAAWDRSLIDRYIADLRVATAAPRYDFVRINATHYNYFYPPEFERFTPTLSSEFSIASGRAANFRDAQQQLKNRYLNAVGYADWLMHRVTDALKSAGRWDRTVVIVVGDHGEEFWEHGKFGHTFGLDNEQLQTVALMHLPASFRGARAACRYTSHYDIFPSLFDRMGVTVDLRRVMRGRSFFDTCSRDSVIASVGITGDGVPNDHVVIGEGRKLQFETPGRIRVWAVFDQHDTRRAEYDSAALRTMLHRALDDLLSPAAEPQPAS